MHGRRVKGQFKYAHFLSWYFRTGKCVEENYFSALQKLRGTKWRGGNERKHAGKQPERSFAVHSDILWNVKINDRAKKSFQRPTRLGLLLRQWSCSLKRFVLVNKTQWETEAMGNKLLYEVCRKFREGVTPQVSYMSRRVRKWKHLSLASWKIITTILMRFDLDSHANTHHLVCL